MTTKHFPEQPQMGRLVAPDPRDQHFVMRKALRRMPAPTRNYRYWKPGPVLDQGSTSSCVGHAWASFLEASPLRTKAHSGPLDIYGRAQLMDEWEGAEPDYYGTSVRAGAKVLSLDGRLAQYLWAHTTQELANWLLSDQGGPVVLGTDWYDGMFDPNSKGEVKLTGGIAGGHAYLCYGYNAKTRTFYCQNSWGREWGRKGRFRIAEADLQVLLDSWGEACTAVEQPLVKPPAARPVA